MKKKLILTSVFLITILLITISLIRQKESLFSTALPKENIILNENSNDKNTNKVIVPTKISKNNLKIETFKRQELKAVSDFILNMKNNYTKINFNSEFRENILNLFSQNKNITQIFKKIILNNEFAISLTKDDQAYARVFAIQGLKEIATSGNQEPLISTIQDFSIYLQDKKTLSKGEQADLGDLLRSYVSIVDIKNMTENMEEHLKKIGFHNSIKNKEILDIYDQYLYFSLAEKIGKEKAKALLEKFIDS